MSTPDIPDLVTGRELRALTAEGRRQMAEEINLRHRKRVYEIITQRDGAADEGVRLRGILDAKDDEIDRLKNNVRRLEAQLENETSMRQLFQSSLDACSKENKQLKLDNAILNGRLIERTDGMLTKQREYLDRARAAESRELRSEASLAFLIPELRTLSEVFGMMSRRRLGTLRDRKSWATLSGNLADYADSLSKEVKARSQAAARSTAPTP